MNILLVENDEVTQKTFTKILEKAGHSVIVVEYPSQAGSMMADNKFDLVISDYLLDTATADETIEQVRSSTVNKNTKILVVSANNDFLKLMRCKGVFTQAKEDLRPANLLALVNYIAVSEPPKRVSQ